MDATVEPHDIEDMYRRAAGSNWASIHGLSQRTGIPVETILSFSRGEAALSATERLAIVVQALSDRERFDRLRHDWPWSTLFENDEADVVPVLSEQEKKEKRERNETALATLLNDVIDEAEARLAALRSEVASRQV